jgi:hypothetical protein
MSESPRRCDLCGVPINKCMGFVKAGDWLDLIDGKIKAEQVRELCGLCVNRVYPVEEDTAAK